MSLSDELVSLSSVEMRRRIGTKEVSPVELVEASIARIEALNPKSTRSQQQISRTRGSSR